MFEPQEEQWGNYTLSTATLLAYWVRNLDWEMTDMTVQLKDRWINTGTKSEPSPASNKPLAQVLFWQPVAKSCGLSTQDV